MAIRSSKELGETIRLARKKLELSQTELARQASVRQALISDLENGVTSAKLDTIIKVLAALRLDLTVAARESGDFDPSAY